MNGWACVLRVGGVGDNIIVTSVLPLLKKKYGKIEVISRAPFSDVFINNPNIDKLTVWPEDEPQEDPTSWQRRISKRATEYDFFVNLSHSMETTLCFMEGQSQFWWPEEARRRIANHSYLEFAHEICCVDKIYDPRFYPTEDEIKLSKETLSVISGNTNGYVVGWCLSGTRIDKIYPTAHLAISRIIAELDCSVVMFGAPGKDFEIAKQIQYQVNAQNGSEDGLHLALSSSLENPNWPLRRILSQIQLCDVVVGPDTGPMWSVSMTDQPKIVLLSHASPKNITSHWNNTTTLHADPAKITCWPCHRLHDRIDTCKQSDKFIAAACISDIGTNKVVQAVGNALSTLA